MKELMIEIMSANMVIMYILRLVVTRVMIYQRLSKMRNVSKEEIRPRWKASTQSQPVAQQLDIVVIKISINSVVVHPFISS